MASPSTNAIRLLILLISSPYAHTRRELLRKIGMDEGNTTTFDRYKNAIETAGILIDRDNHHRYAIIPQTGFKSLTALSPLTDQDKSVIKEALDTLPAAKSHALYGKLDSLYDFQRLGLESLRRPEIDKIDALEGAIQAKQRVKLIRYRSKTSNTERDRVVEPFQVQTEIGTVLAYDTEKMRTAHFKLSRMERVQVLDQKWVHEEMHQHHPSDIFEIVDSTKVPVNLRLRVSAYNDLIELHPQARIHIRPASEPDTFDLQAPVNHKFIGLLPFLLANWNNVTILGPAELRERVRMEVGRMVEWAG